MSGPSAPMTPEYFPSVQLKQVPDEVAPGNIEYFPALQSRHEVFELAPGTSENFPAMQSMQAESEVAGSGRGWGKMEGQWTRGSRGRKDGGNQRRGEERQGDRE